MWSLTGGSATFGSKNVGQDKQVTGTGFVLSGADAANYSLASSTLSTTADITELAVTGHFTADDKVYDGNVGATINGRSVSGEVAGDDVVLTGGSATFGSKNVGQDKQVTGTGFVLSGADAANYSLASSTLSTTADITELAVTGHFTAADKVYDGNVGATINGRSVSGEVAGDDVVLTGGSATFGSKNVGQDKTVTGTGFVLSGADAANYSLASSTLSTTADITELAVTGHFTAADKVYDGNVGATINGRSVSGEVAGDDVVLTGGSATFGSKNVGQDKTVTGTGFVLSGADAANYSLASSTLSTTADITELAVTGHFTAADKVYDGNVGATINGRSVSGEVAGDDVVLTGGSATFGSKNVGQDKQVTGTGFVLSGADAANYSLASSTLSTTADITELAVTGHFTAADKVYDGNVGATINGRSVSGEVAGDDVVLTGGSATFGSKNVGQDKQVTGTGFVLSGADAGNYSLASSTLSTTADITERPLTVVAEPKSKLLGELDPALTYHISSGSLVAGAFFSGALTRDPGRDGWGVPHSPGHPHSGIQLRLELRVGESHDRVPMGRLPSADQRHGAHGRC